MAISKNLFETMRAKFLVKTNNLLAFQLLVFQKNMNCFMTNGIIKACIILVIDHVVILLY